MKDRRNEEPIYINMLGEFSFSYGGKTVLKDQGRTHKVWVLLGYLIANRHRKLEPEELPEILCSDERSADPSKVVKNLIYRLRCLLSDSALPEKNYIVQKGGIYSWNNDIYCIIDIEEFQKYLKRAESEKEPEKKLANELKALEIYKGRFIPTGIYDEWTINLATKCQEQYMETINRVFAAMQDHENYEPLIEICERGIKSDPFDENIYIIYIKSLISVNRKKEALKAYETIVNRLYNELGINPSSQLSLLYREIIKSIRSVETDLLTIKRDLNEPGPADLSYFCEYEIFKDIYRFIARGVERTGDSIYIMLCTLTDEEDGIPHVSFLGSCMDALKLIIGKALRKGDLFARYSSSQFVLMLPRTTYENGCMIGERIATAFRKSSSNRKADFHFKLQPLDSKDSSPPEENL